VKLNGGQHFLGKHPEDAPPPNKGRDGKWKPPGAILDEFYRLMALRDTAAKSDLRPGNRLRPVPRRTG
jgi:hypothetical protein